MPVRPIRPDELDAFAALGADPEHAAEVRAYLDRMFASGAMRPAWCYVAEDAGRPLGRVAFWTLPGRELPLDLVLLDLPWDGPDPTLGDRLLRDVLRDAHTMGADTIGHVLDTPPMWPQWQDHHDQRRALLERIGFVPERETCRFEWRSEAAVAADPPCLTYRALPDVGEDAFVAALARVSTDSLDQRVQRDRERLGAEGEARESLADLRQMEHESEWWNLAFTPNGELVGLIMPAKNPTSATIGYIGVVPEQRGHGYVDDLLAHGTATLIAAGAATIRADTDVDNLPMRNAFRRAGWAQFATRREYRIDLATR